MCQDQQLALYSHYKVARLVIESVETAHNRRRSEIDQKIIRDSTKLGRAQPTLIKNSAGNFTTRMARGMPMNRILYARYSRALSEQKAERIIRQRENSTHTKIGKLLMINDALTISIAEEHTLHAHRLTQTHNGNYREKKNRHKAFCLSCVQPK